MKDERSTCRVSIRWLAVIALLAVLGPLFAIQQGLSWGGHSLPMSPPDHQELKASSPVPRSPAQPNPAPETPNGLSLCDVGIAGTQDQPIPRPMLFSATVQGQALAGFSSPPQRPPRIGQPRNSLVPR